MSGSRLSVRESIMIGLAACVLVASLFYMQAGRTAHSSEAKFSDNSRGGLSIVPASCPSSPHYSGECSCTPSYSCSGNGVLNSCTGAVTACLTGQTCSNAQCQDTFSCASVKNRLNNHTGVVTPCGFSLFCSAGQCIGASPMSFVVFSATANPANGTGTPVTFTATGHLQVRPSLVLSGDHVQVYWQVSNVESCSITGKRGAATVDSWTGESSNTGGKLSNPILGQTIYTLACTGLDDSMITESATVNILPSFEEK